MASTITIRLASRTYDGTLPILRGQMQVPGFNLDIAEMSDVAGMFKGQYDVGEMSLGELIYYISRTNAAFIGSRCFLPECFGTDYFLPPLFRDRRAR